MIEVIRTAEARDLSVQRGVGNETEVSGEQNLRYILGTYMSPHQSGLGRGVAWRGRQ